MSRHQPSAPLRYDPAVESLEPDEAETTRELVETLHKISVKTFEDGGQALRSVHAKGHGILQGELEVISGLPPMLAQGMFAAPRRYPAVLRLVHLVVRNWVVSGLLISLIAGTVACIALARLTEFEWRARRLADGGASRAAVTAVLLLVCAPAAVFLAAGYTESLFLALGIPAWLAARQRRWVLAGVLTALACAVRIDGVFEAAGIGVMFLLGRPKAKDWARAPALVLPLAAVGGYFAYLNDIKGSWLAWFTAEHPVLLAAITRTPPGFDAYVTMMRRLARP